MASLQGQAPPAASKPAAAPAPLSFADFHTLQATTDYLKRVAATSPAIPELV
jgi:hypothetical protein